jgi:tetratricopeptide (TPR) repeat protein
MSENIGNTQPVQPLKEDDTQPVQPVKKVFRWRSTLISIFGFLLLLGLGGFGGYSSGISARRAAQDTILSKQAGEQFTLALVDIQFGRYETAKQRLEFVINTDPNYPGASAKLTEVLILSTVPSPTPMPTVTATPDFSGAESAFQRAQQLIAAKDWPGSLTALDSIRKLDPTYKTAQVDGMYYFALRNNGYDSITKHGNLEGGIYYLTLAERFGPLDNTAIGIRDGARMYITGASFWQLDWKQAVDYFSQVSAGWPSLWDGTMTASQRFYYASMRYGDSLYQQQEYCSANEQYTNAAALGTLDNTAAKNAQDAYNQCFPATPTSAPVATLPPAATATP